MATLTFDKVPVENASCKITFVLEDEDEVALSKAAISALTLTLTDSVTRRVINSRSSQSVLDANGGTVASNGTLTLNLSPSDNINVGSSAGSKESHFGVLTWTWTDDASVAWTGKQEFIVLVSTTSNHKLSTDIEIIRGDSYDNVAHDKITWAVMKNYTGWTGTMTVRHRLTSASLMSVTVTVDSSSQLSATLTTANTAFALLVDNEEFGPHPYDVEMVSGSSEETAFSGVVVVRKDRTEA